MREVKSWPTDLTTNWTEAQPVRWWSNYPAKGLKKRGISHEENKSIDICNEGDARCKFAYDLILRVHAFSFMRERMNFVFYRDF